MLFLPGATPRKRSPMLGSKTAASEQLKSLRTLKEYQTKHEETLTNAIREIASLAHDDDVKIVNLKVQPQLPSHPPLSNPAMLQTVSKTLRDCWLIPRIGDDLAFSLSDFLRETHALEKVTPFQSGPQSPQSQLQVIELFTIHENSERLRVACGLVLVESLSENNLAYLASNRRLVDIITSAIQLARDSPKDNGASITTRNLALAQ